MRPLKNYGLEYDEASKEWQRNNDFEADQQANIVRNVPKQNILQLFPNLKRVSIETTVGGRSLQEKGKYPEFKFPIAAFLSLVDGGRASIYYVINAERRKDDNFDYVGENFAYEARSIHYNNKKKNKGIYGTASKQDLKELKEEGIDAQLIPWVENENN